MIWGDLHKIWVVLSSGSPEKGYAEGKFAFHSFGLPSGHGVVSSAAAADDKEDGDSFTDCKSNNPRFP